MANYLYRCPRSHETTRQAAMGQAPQTTDCHCGGRARRAFTAPMLTGTRPDITAAMDRAHASAETPAQTTHLPPAGPVTGVSRDPRHSLLPRP